MLNLFYELINAIMEGDIEKVTKIIFALTKDKSQVIIPSKPLFTIIEKLGNVSGEIKELSIALFYPGWVLTVLVSAEEKHGEIMVKVRYNIKTQTAGG